jgi:hypothetical protein
VALVLAAGPRPDRSGKGEEKRARRAIENLGGKVIEEAGGPEVRVFWESDRAADKDLAHLGALRGLRELILDCPGVSNAGLARLKGLTGLRELRLYGDQFTDRGLVSLEGLTGLPILVLMSEQITDAGLAHLKALAGLEKLELASPKVTDSGLAHLKGLRKLKKLRLGIRSKVTPEGIKRLRQSLPNLVVTY